jgi:hypothetical protein
MTTLVHVHDIFANKTTRKRIRAGVTLRELAECATGPHIVTVNGTPVLRAEWGAQVLSGQLVCVIEVPQGGSSRDIARLLATIALMVILGPSGFALQGVAYSAAFIAGSIAINMLLPPIAPNVGGGPAASPTYSVGFQGNTARLKQSIPVRYGYGRWYPDHASQPYYRYIGDEQYLYMLLCVGQGEYDFTVQGGGHFLDDTPLAEFEDIDFQVIEPGDLGTLLYVDSAMVTAPEVSGQDMLTDAVVGPFTVCGRGQKVDSIGIDMVWPKGLYPNKTTEWLVEAQLIDEYDTPLSAWATLGEESRTGDTTTQLRESYEYAVSEGRYRVRVTRTDTRSDSTSVAHDQAWVGLRAVLKDGDVVNTTCTFIEVRARASKQLSGVSQSRFNSIGTRKLPIWNGSTWSAPTATRSIAWAWADMHRNTDYGLSWPDSRLDLAGLLELDAIWTERGDYFDFSFDSRRAFLESSRLTARAGRAGAIYRLGIGGLVRDAAQTLPAAVFNMTNIERDSMGINYRVASSDSPDGIELTYWDSIAQEERTFDSLPRHGLTDSSHPEEVVLHGVTGRAHADRERHYMVADFSFRPITAQWTTGAEGMRCTYLDLVAVHHDKMPRTQGGRTTDWDSSTRTLTLSEPAVFTNGETAFVGWSDESGAFAGPYECTPGLTAYDVVLSVSPSSAPLTEGLNEERSKYVFGKLTYCVVRAVEPSGNGRVRITASVEDDRVHTADEDVLDVPYSGAPTYEEPPSSGASITINDHPVNGSDGVTTGYARYIVKADGTVHYEQNGAAGAFAGEWCGTPAEAAGFDVRFDVMSGDALDEGTTGTWLRLDTDRAIAQLEPELGGFALTQVQVRIRNAVTLDVKDSAVITLAAQGPAIGGE